MNEPQWWSCTDPRAMLEFLRGTGRASDRKQRLFAVASLRCVSHLLSDSGSRKGLGVLERLADGESCEEERRQATKDARNAYYEAECAGDEPRLFAGIGLYRGLVAGSVNVGTTEAHLWALRAAYALGEAAEEHQCQLLRLSDALEEAGCRDADILTHCREQGRVHVRGCWVVDFLLGKL
jgi:hypothetical protein